jgi:hypothetical protein
MFSAGASGNAIEFISPPLSTVVGQKIKSATSAHRAATNSLGKFYCWCSNIGNSSAGRREGGKSFCARAARADYVSQIAYNVGGARRPCIE